MINVHDKKNVFFKTAKLSFNIIQTFSEKDYECIKYA